MPPALLNAVCRLQWLLDQDMARLLGITRSDGLSVMAAVTPQISGECWVRLLDTCLRP
jgi:hypothetical protein